MAKEYGIKTSYKSPTGETKYFKKSTLFNQIVSNYLEKRGLSKKQLNVK